MVSLFKKTSFECFFFAAFLGKNVCISNFEGKLIILPNSLVYHGLYTSRITLLTKTTLN